MNSLKVCKHRHFVYENFMITSDLLDVVDLEPQEVDDADIEVLSTQGNAGFSNMNFFLNCL